MLINGKNFEIVELKKEEDLLKFSINTIAKSLMIVEGTDPEIALLSGWFISNSKKPDIQELKNNFLTDYNSIKTLILIPERWVIDLIKLMKINKLTNFESNQSYLSIN